MRKLALFATVATLAAMPALAQTQTQGTTTRPGTTATQGASRAEAVSAAEFVHMAAMSDMYEIQSSRLAEQHSQNAQVKQFAQEMLRDHQKTTNELQNLVRQAGSTAHWQMPQSLDQQHMQKIQQLQNARGAEFDRHYVTQQMQAHQMAVDLFRNYSQHGDNAQLRQWASNTLPALQDHLQKAQQLQRGMGNQGAQGTHGSTGR